MIKRGSCWERRDEGDCRKRGNIERQEERGMGPTDEMREPWWEKGEMRIKEMRREMKCQAKISRKSGRLRNPRAAIEEKE